jgi:O-antigen/teichoic acid export membrane protein
MFGISVFLNFASLAFAGLQIIFVNFWLLKFEGLEVLAVFNFSYLVAAVGSQLSTFGVHYSLLYRLSNLNDRVANELYSALLIVISFSVIIGLLLSLFFLVAPPKPISGNIIDNILVIVFSILIISCNKLFLAYINSKGKMTFYSIIFLIRSFLLVVGMLIHSHLFAIEHIFLIVLISEVAVLLIMILFFAMAERKQSWVTSKKLLINSVRAHLDFGRYTAMGAVALESNVRVDSFFISMFCSVEQFSKYSFLSIIFEGLLQMFSVFRNFVNILILKKDRDSVAILKKFMALSILFGFITFCCVVFLFDFVIDLIGIPLEGMYGSAILLSLAILFSSSFLPFDQVSNQLGKPERYFFASIFVVSVNVLFNLLMVPIWGSLGAAFSTLLSYMVFSVFIVINIQKFKIFKMDK